MESLLHQDKVNHCVLFLITSVVLVLFLFFIDEGYYNFNWMKSFGSWIVFAIYTLVLFLGQYLIHSIIKKYVNSSLANLLSIVLGVFISLSFLFLIVF